MYRYDEGAPILLQAKERREGKRMVDRMNEDQSLMGYVGTKKEFTVHPPFELDLVWDFGRRLGPHVHCYFYAPEVSHRHWLV